jgi:two-component system LytT family sensor kinase
MNLPPPAEGAAPASRSWPLVWAWSLAVWFVVWALMSSQVYAYYRGRDLPVPWIRFVASLAESLLWGLVSPLVLWFCWRWPLSGGRWRTTLPLHLLAGLLLPAAFIAPATLARYALGRALADPSLYQPLSPGLLFHFLVGNIFTYIDVVAVGHALHYARDSRAKDLRASRLEARLAEAQLQVLRMQLHPHFLFNTLHTISALMHKDLKAADRMLALLGDLLRDSFAKIGAQEVTLKQELDFLERYLEIEKTRFQDRLRVETKIDPETLDAEVPNLLLQPLVENALRHGIARRREAGLIELVARRENGRLELRVRDDGPGLPSEAEMSRRGGVGLANTQARLQQLYGSAHRFELLNRPEGGLEVVLSLPFRVQGQALEEGNNPHVFRGGVAPLSEKGPPPSSPRD